MKTSGNTVLITGGSAGIGLAIAQLLVDKGNHVIITGRNKERLENAASRLKNATPIVSDVTSERDAAKLAQILREDFPQLNMVINNAGQAFYYRLEKEANAFEKAAEEMLTNYLAVVNLNEKLLPLLEQRAAAAIVNVSSIVALTPGSRLPTYAASKAALHSYTQSLRHSLKHSGIKVFELMPPLVNTEFSREIGGESGIPPAQVAQEFIEAWANDAYEIHVGDTQKIYELQLSSPEAAFAAMNP